MAGIVRERVALRTLGSPLPGESVAELFHENTKFQRVAAETADADAQDYGARELGAMARAYKRYRLRPHVKLPSPLPHGRGSTFGELVASRRSRREFTSEPLALDELAAMLTWSYGVTAEIDIPGGVQAFRAAPSAGALYPAEIYLGVRAVHGLDAGIYHYEVPAASLALLERGDPTDRLYEVCCGQDYARQAAVVVLITGVIERTRRKYGDRGYRYVLIDVGHLGQNLYLACTALGLAIVTSGGFFDDEGADLLGIDGCEEALLYAAFVGPLGETPPPHPGA